MSIQNKCTAVLGSVTAATAAKRALARAAIYSETVKLSDSAGGRGCVYGVEFPCSMTDNVRSVLSDAGIRARRYFNGEEGHGR